MKNMSSVLFVMIFGNIRELELGLGEVIVVGGLFVCHILMSTHMYLKFNRLCRVDEEEHPLPKPLAASQFSSHRL